MSHPTDTWLDIVEDQIDVGAVYQWAVRPDCGAVVVFSGTTRDHAAGREDVRLLEYEAYHEHVVDRFGQIVAAAREQWPAIRRAAILHRVGVVELTESSVVVAVSSAHRDVAFEAARYCIDTLKATAPIWKREVWRDGESWGLDSREIAEVALRDRLVEVATQAAP